MAKKNKFISILFVLVCLGALMLYTFSRSAVLAQMSTSVSQARNGSSVVGFTGVEGNTIQVRYSSKVKEGKLIFSLMDEDGAIIETFSGGVSDMKEIVLDHGEEYRLYADCDNFVGKYKIEVIRQW